MLIEAHLSTNLTCRAIFSENPCFPIGYRQPLIFQYIYHIKLATLGTWAIYERHVIERHLPDN